MIYLFYGPDSFACGEALQQLKAAVPEEVADLNISQLEGRKLKLADLQSACEAFPFLAERRLVIVREALKQLKAADQREALQAYLAQVPTTADLVFVETDEPDGRLGVVKELLKRAEVRVFKPLEGEALLRWVERRSELLEVRIEPAAIRALVEAAGSEGWALWNELRKLAAYVGAGGTIKRAAVELLVADEVESNLFAFIDALFGRPGPQTARLAFNRLHQLLDAGEAPHYILFMITRQVRLLLGVQGAGRASPNELARTLGQRPFVVQKAQEQARGFSPQRLQALHDRLVELDRALKTGQIEPAAAVDLLVGELVLRPFA